MLKFTDDHERLKVEDGVATFDIAAHVAGQPVGTANTFMDESAYKALIG